MTREEAGLSGQGDGSPPSLGIANVYSETWQGLLGQHLDRQEAGLAVRGDGSPLS